MLRAEWMDPFHVSVISGTEVLAELPVERGLRTKDDLRYVLKHDGNTKTAGVIGIVNMISQGCFREYVGYPQSGVSCYSDGTPGSGCYANATRHAEVRRKDGFDVIHNGVHPGTEGFFRIRVPEVMAVPEGVPTRIYRVDSETADGSMSLALGLVQDFAEANPSRKVTTISSAYFDVPDSEVARAAGLENLVVGFTVSSWFDEVDLGNRVSELRRFLDFGVTSVVWVATDPRWESVGPRADLVAEALGMVRPEAVIEVPYHDKGTHEFSSLGVNPWGACCDSRFDSKGRKIDLATYTVEQDGERVKPAGKSGGTGRCEGCKLQCGVRYLHAENSGKFEAAA